MRHQSLCAVGSGAGTGGAAAACVGHVAAGVGHVMPVQHWHHMSISETVPGYQPLVVHGCAGRAVGSAPGWLPLQAAASPLSRCLLLGCTAHSLPVGQMWIGARQQGS